MKEWKVGLKLDLGETRIECSVTVRAADKHDAVAKAIGVLTGGVRIAGVSEINARETMV
jgi:hypothetical protein